MKDLSTLDEQNLEDLSLHNIPVKDLVDACNPLSAWLDIKSPITKEEVLECIKSGGAELTDTNDPTTVLFNPTDENYAEARKAHIKKIAYFAINEPKEPIHIDVGVPDLHCYVDHIIQDGNHRLAGSLIAGRETISAGIIGSEEHAKELGVWHPNEYLQELIKRWNEKRRSMYQEKIESFIEELDGIPPSASNGEKSFTLHRQLFNRYAEITDNYLYLLDDKNEFENLFSTGKLDINHSREEGAYLLTFEDENLKKLQTFNLSNNEKRKPQRPRLR